MPSKISLQDDILQSLNSLTESYDYRNVLLLDPAGKVRLVSLPNKVKDPSDMYTQVAANHRKGVCKILYRALFQAEKYSPAGVMSLALGSAVIAGSAWAWYFGDDISAFLAADGQPWDSTTKL